jgi:hypothetical protein
MNFQDLDINIISGPKNFDITDTGIKNQGKRMNLFSHDNFIPDQKYEVRCTFEQRFREIRKYFILNTRNSMRR